MLSDEEKKVIAMNNLSRFYDRMQVLCKDDSEKELVAVYVFKKNGRCIEDFYWSDEELTPSGFYRWLVSYNNGGTSDDDWIERVNIPEHLFNQLTELLGLRNVDTINFDGVIVSVLP